MYTTLIELAPGTIVLSLDGRRRGAIAEPDTTQSGIGPGFCYVYWLDRFGCRTTKRPEQVDRSELLLTAHVRQPVEAPRPQAGPPEPSHIVLDYIGRMFDALPSPEMSEDPNAPLPVWHFASQRFGTYEPANGWRNGKVHVRWEGSAICTAWVPVSELVVVTQDRRYRAPLADFLPDHVGAAQSQPATRPDRTAQASIMDHVAQMFEGLTNADGKPIKVQILKPTTAAAAASELAAAVQAPSAPEPQPQAPVVPGMSLKRGTKRTLGACSFCSCPSTDDNQPMWQLSGDRLRVRSCDGCLSQALQKASEAGLVDEQA